MTAGMAATALPIGLARRFEAVVVVGDPAVRTAPAPGLHVLHAGALPTSLPQVLDALWRRGVSAADVLVVDDGTGPSGRIEAVRRAASLATVVCAGPTASDLPDGVLRLPDGPAGVAAVLGDQVRRRARRELPHPTADDGWTLRLDGLDEEQERVWEALLAVADGRVGITGAPLAEHPSAQPTALVAGVYDGEDASTHLLPAPLALRLPYRLPVAPRIRRTLDLRSGLLHEVESTTDGELAAVRFASLSRPGTAVLRARCPDGAAHVALSAPPGAQGAESGSDGATRWLRVAGSSGGVVTAVETDAVGTSGAGMVLDGVAAYEGDPGGVPPSSLAVEAARAASGTGFERLLDEHRQRWAQRWESADVLVEQNPALQLATRLMLFHLMGSVADRDEAAVGARGITGHGYSGHVFWDADTFVLPFFAATHPASARAMLEYRLRRLPAAMSAARAVGRSGARFPWESARTGHDVTPATAYDRAGRLIDVRTGPHEEHIVSEVAWAAGTYVDWTGDVAFARGPGLRLLVETARWWASRVQLDDDGSGHIRGVIGPDEYHEDVDDDAFTNVMARWNLKRAADAVGEPGSADVGVTEDESHRWREIAATLVDGYDLATGRHEQFPGFSALEPLVIAEVAPRRPIAADVLMGRERVQATQVIKQPAVLMLHHLVPDELPAGSLLADLAFYEPRTAHGSSLSPGVHAALLARAGRLKRAVDALEITARMDLDDLTGTTAAGIHLATAGALWQALVMGFAGVRPVSGRLTVDPHVPEDWGELEVRLRFHGSHVRVRCSAGDVDVRADPPVPVTVRGAAATATPDGLRPSPQPPGGEPR
jgi:trehalose/maltose hydrolase-like predicted phosphorylase